MGGGIGGTKMRRFRPFMWIATALWLIAAAIDRGMLNAVAWFGSVAAGALSASGTTERSRRLAYLSIALLVSALSRSWLWRYPASTSSRATQALLSNTPYSHHVI